MAVTKMPQLSALGLKVQTGTNNAGDPVYKVVRFSNIKATATDDDIHAVGLALADLQKNPLSNIVRYDTANLLNM